MSGERFSDDELRRAFQAYGDRPGGADDLDPDRVWDAVEGARSAEERRAVVDALASQPEAGLTWRLAHALKGDAKAPEAEAEVLPLRRRLWLAAPLAAAAALMITVMQSPFMGMPKPAYRDAVEQGAISAGADSSFSRSDFVLRWSAVDGATRYAVRVTTDAFEPVAAQENLTATEFHIAPEALQRFRAGTTLLWQVTAFVAGETVRSSTFTARLRDARKVKEMDR